MKPGKLIPPVLLLGLGACAYWLYFVQDTPEAPSVLTPAAEQAIATLHKQGIDTEAYSTRLTEAAAAGDTELVRLLLTAQADSAAADAQFNTALHKAAAAGHADTCRALVELGCAPSTTAGKPRYTWPRRMDTQPACKPSRSSGLRSTARIRMATPR